MPDTRTDFSIWLDSSRFYLIVLPHNDGNEAQGQPAFAKTTEAIPCRLDFIVRAFLFFS
jgi:hypothetical protein